MVAKSDETSEAAPKARVFISYSRKDMAFADRLEAALKARGFEPLIDRTEIYAFEDWWKRIEALIGRADTVVFVLSPDAVASDVALKEVAHAASLNKRFAPIVCRRVEDGAIPEALRRLNFIFFDDPARFEASADRLAEALQTDIGWVRQHTEFGEAARRWAAAGRPSGPAAALAGAGGSRALDRLAPARRAGADRGDAGLRRREPTRHDAAAQHPHRKPRGRARRRARARRACLLAAGHCRRTTPNRDEQRAAAEQQRRLAEEQRRIAASSTPQGARKIRSRPRRRPPTV